MRIGIVTLLLLFSMVVPVQSQTCVPTLPLESGDTARVLAGLILNVRPEPTTSLQRVGTVTAGTTFTVLDGPQCNEGYVWWQGDFGEQTGWVAEGGDELWLEARGERVMVDGEAFIRVESDNPEIDGMLEPEGCLRPPDDYTVEQIGYARLNRRTLAMLDQAQRIYDGPVNFRQAITQGSYNPGAVAASFGTHDGGGAVDLSVRDYRDWSVLEDEIEPMLRALRIAGFAAWLRDTGELYPNSSIHIHAIAVGDAELSPAAQRQIDGREGYLYGYNGLPTEDDVPPIPDRYGGPVICGWMLED
jgi:hypothetical protein